MLKTAPIGVGCLMIATLAEQGSRLLAQDKADSLLLLLQSLGWFAAAVVFGLLLHVFVVLPTLLFVFGRVNPIKHYRAMLPAMLTAFSTSSSNATLPVTIECVEQNVGVSRRTASFVLPLGATVNMDGTALYECVAAMFVVQLFGIELSLADQFLVVMVALLTSVGVAGVPSASLVAIIIILQSLDKQLASRGVEVSLQGGLALILIFDRVLDMARTVVNIFSDSCATVIVARSMGEEGFYESSTGSEIAATIATESADEARGE
ncbi:MAG: dicarboxylate/amino acid:cation symporter [Pirellulaceae bacterium]